MDQLRDAGHHLQEHLLRPVLNLHARCRRSVSLLLNRNNSSPSTSASENTSDYHFCVCPSSNSAAGRVSPLASISRTHAQSSTTRPQEVASVGLAPSFIAPRLQAVKVWAITNVANEFILVSGDQKEDRQLGLLCFSEDDAVSLLKQVKSKDPRMGRNARVTEVSLDKVYNLMASSDGSTEGVTFRFIPDAYEVQAALKLQPHRKHFVGVPVFQAEGLTVKTKKDTLLPLFFSKTDLDNAVQKAYSGKANPKIEVGSFENVLRTMELVAEKESSDWMDVVFMPAKYGQ